MPEYGIAEAKAKFSELIARAERGEEVVITRYGKPVVRWSRLACRETGRPVSVAELRAALAKQPMQKTWIVDDIIATRREDRD